MRLRPAIILLLAVFALAACNLSRVETATPPPLIMTLPFNPPSPTEAPALPEAAQPQNVLFLGDSITQGWNLNAILPGAINAGRTGDTSSQVMARYLQLYAGQSFDAVVLQVGINDITGGVSLDTLRQNLVTLIGWLQSSNQRVLVGSLLPVGQAAFGPAIHQRILEMNAWLRDFAGAQGLRYVDYYSAMIDGSGRTIDSFFQDGVHPTASGYQAMSDVLLQALN